jgi:VIT1/CCC1 family predicted Fe2+/Mn2+ transporter
MWPDQFRRSRSIDEFLWKGDRRAKLIQRAALVLYSLMFLFVAVVFMILAWKIGDDWIMRAVCVAFGCLLGAGGVRFARNVFLQ